MAITAGGSATLASADNVEPFTITGLSVVDADDYLVVGLAFENTRTVDAVTFDPTGSATAMTQVPGSRATAGTDSVAELWYLLDADLPTSGTFDIEVNFSANTPLVAYAQLLQGAAQQAAEAVNASSGNSGSFSTSITTVTDGAWVLDMAGTAVQSTLMDPGTGQTEIVDADGGGTNNHGMGSHKEVATAGSTTMDWTKTNGGVGDWSHSLAAIAPAGATGSPGLEGSVWIEGTDLHWIDANDTEQNVTGTDTGNDPAGAVAGSCWIEGSDLHYIDASGNERTITGTDAGNDPAGAVSGSAWIEGANLHYIDASGNERTIS